MYEVDVLRSNDPFCDDLACVWRGRHPYCSVPRFVNLYFSLTKCVVSGLLHNHDTGKLALTVQYATKTSVLQIFKVNRFKALIIGGGGVFAARHDPLHVEKFAEGLTLPIVIMGVGARWECHLVGLHSTAH